jgi:peptidyl-prolyl cis-trans isomerase C
MPDPDKTTRNGAEFRYHLLRAATERFQRNIPALSPEQRAEAERQAQKTFTLETLVLGSDEAGAVVIPADQLDAAFDAIATRYADADEMAADLAHNGLDPAGLRRALRRELVFDAVMQRIGAGHTPIDEHDEHLFYELHRERFEAPERRTARHILITVNDDYAENTRDAALARLEAIASTLRGDDADGLIERFASAARRHSECPTALEDGRLGTVPRGQLYPALDAALFQLGAGQLSGILESPVGLHLLLCEQIQPARALPFSQARPRIREALEQRRRRDTQRTWLKTLQGHEVGSRVLHPPLGERCE